ncbi:general secretion pathway protein GspB [Rhodoferax sp.]|uniref:general secretion pathway protein GspB n=1 Tax=Rhodoferax sp. TaxID=50421 RepID=UPI00374D8501
MSYILDALKRADTERERGNVPGLHTRQLATPSGQTVPAASRSLWLTVAAVVALAGIGVGLWVWQTPAEAPRSVILKPVVASPPVSAAVTPSVAPTAALPEISASVKPKPAPTIAAPTATPTPPKTKPKPGPAAATAAPASAELTALPLLSELADDLRRQVPALTITGAVYAKNPAQRLLLVNNLVLTQGALAAPEVKLEEIQPRSAVFSFRGTRFRLLH